MITSLNDFFAHQGGVHAVELGGEGEAGGVVVDAVEAPYGVAHEFAACHTLVDFVGVPALGVAEGGGDVQVVEEGEGGGDGDFVLDGVAPVGSGVINVVLFHVLHVEGEVLDTFRAVRAISSLSEDKNGHK